MNNEKLKWHKLPKQYHHNLELLFTHLVLARNDQDSMMMGFLSYEAKHDFYAVQNGRQCLERITHYIKQSELLKLGEYDEVVCSR